MKLSAECNNCHKVVEFEPPNDGSYADPDAALVCGCCPMEGQDGHHHGEHANSGNEPCRPITISTVVEPGQPPPVIVNFG